MPRETSRWSSDPLIIKPPSQPKPPPDADGARVLLADEDRAFRGALATLISGQSDLTICGEVSNLTMGLAAMRELKPDVAVIGVSSIGSNDLEAVKLIGAEQPELKILMLFPRDEPLGALRALRAGAKGCVTKAEGIQGVLAALRKVIKGEIYLTKRFSEWLLFQAIQAGGETGTPIDRLTDRELEILYLLGRGLGTQQMAQELHLGVKTIETHRGNIRKKLGFQDVREMIRFAIDWVEQEGAT